MEGGNVFFDLVAILNRSSTTSFGRTRAPCSCSWRHKFAWLAQIPKCWDLLDCCNMRAKTLSTGLVPLDSLDLFGVRHRVGRREAGIVCCACPAGGSTGTEPQVRYDWWARLPGTGTCSSVSLLTVLSEGAGRSQVPPHKVYDWTLQTHPSPTFETKVRPEA